MMGELSPFFDAFGIFADGVSPETSKLPEGWRDRLVKVQNENTNGAIGWCLDPTDLAIAKHVAGEEEGHRVHRSNGPPRPYRPLGVPRTARNGLRHCRAPRTHPQPIRRAADGATGSLKTVNRTSARIGAAPCVRAYSGSAGRLRLVAYAVSLAAWRSARGRRRRGACRRGAG